MGWNRGSVGGTRYDSRKGGCIECVGRVGGTRYDSCKGGCIGCVGRVGGGCIGVRGGV